MPDIPYKPVPSVQPVERATPGISVTFPSVNFTKSIGTALGELGEGRKVLGRSTEQVGAALASLGKSIEGAGDEVWNRAVAIKHVENETAAVEADTKFMMQSAQMYSDFESKTGNAASGGLQAHMQGLENARQQIRGTLTNDDARHAYDQKSLRTLGATIFSAAKHASAQGKAAALGAATANFKMSLSDLENHAGDMTGEQFEQRRQEIIRDTVQPMLKLEQLDKGPQSKLRMMEIMSSIWGARINGMMKTDPDKANSELKTLRDNNEILSPVADKLQASIDENRVRVAARNEGDKATSWMYDKTRNPDEPPKPVTQMVEEAWKNLPPDMQKGPLAPRAREEVERNIESAVRRYDYARNTSIRDNYDFTISKFYDPKGVIKPSFDAVIADPAAYAAYDALPRDAAPGRPSQRAVRDAFARHVINEERVNPYESLTSLAFIKGMASDSNESREQLLNMNMLDKDLKKPNGEPLRMNLTEARAAQKIRESLKTNPDGDPRVNKFWKALVDNYGRDMTDLGLEGPVKDAVKVMEAKGALSGAIDEYEESHKGLPPDWKAFKDEIVPRFLQHQSAEFWKPSTWFPGGREAPIFTKKPPDEWREGFIAQFKTERGVSPPESTILRAYQQGLWRELRKQGMIKKDTTPAAAAPTEALE